VLQLSVRYVQYVIGARRRSLACRSTETSGLISTISKRPSAKIGSDDHIVTQMGIGAMATEGRDQGMNRRTNVMDDFNFGNGVQASSSETAEYLAQMASELVLLAKNARLERLSLLLDLVRREAESAAA